MVNKNIDEILFDITPDIQKLANLCEKNNAIDKELFVKNKFNLQR